jgi:1-acyl-sn-glycerol-3-phosphate acyltransferase
MKNILAYILTPIYYLVFGLLLAIFHPVQMIGWHVWGYEGQKRGCGNTEYFNYQKSVGIGQQNKIHWAGKIPQGKPLIIVSNHQSQYDIPPVVWYFKKITQVHLKN